MRVGRERLYTVGLCALCIVCRRHLHLDFLFEAKPLNNPFLEQLKLGHIRGSSERRGDQNCIVKLSSHLTAKWFKGTSTTPSEYGV